MTRHLLLLAALAALTALAAPAGASAATARVVVVTGDARTGLAPEAHLDVAAAAGERNAITVAREAGGAWLVRDSGAPLSSGAGCASLDAGTVRCVQPPATEVRGTAVVVQAGDRGDRVTIAAELLAQVRAGDGDDAVSASGVLDGGAGDDTLRGGPHEDSLIGGPGRDVLRAGAGNDFLAGDGSTARTRDGDEVIDGGAGSDTVSYRAQRAGLTVDLADGRADGVTGRRDRLRDIENIIGGRGADTLRGNRFANVIDGGDGRDRISGRGGADRLDGDRGADTVRGGGGADRLRAGAGGDDRLFGEAGADLLSSFDRDARLDAGAGDDEIVLVSRPASLSCGSGRDRLVPLGGPSRSVLPPRTIDGCEHVSFGAGVVALGATPLRPTRTTLALAVACRRLEGTPARGCGGTVVMRLVGRDGRTAALGSGRFALGAGASGTVGLTVPAARRRALASARRPLLEVVVRGTTSSADPAFPTALPQNFAVAFGERWRAHAAT